MTKEEKRKKGLIKVYYFDQKCKCVNPSLFTKRVNSKDHMICSTCNCVVSNKIIDFIPHIDHNLELEVV